MVVVQNAHAGLIAEIQPLPVPLQQIHHPQALFVMLEAALVDLVQRPLSGVAEGRVPQIVPQGDGLRQILVEPQGPGHRPRKPRHLQGVGQAGAVVIPLRLEEDLGLVLEAAKGLGVGDPVNIPLEAGANVALRFRVQPTPAVLGEHAVGPDHQMLQLFSFLAGKRHSLTSHFRLLPLYDGKNNFPFLFPTNFFRTFL